MAEQLKYVSPEYQARLDRLAETLVTSRRFGGVAVNQLVLFNPDGSEVVEPQEV